jgi:farnesyl-diphosphate farnesyltransferase
MNSARRLLGPVLRDISRSFYVSIRLLPRRLREPVGLAYLLARATDTLADTAKIPASVRLDALGKLTSAIQGTSAANGSIVDFRQSFAPLQVNGAERTLIEVLPDILQSLDLQNAADRGDIREVLGNITRAQQLDIDRFSNSTEVSALGTTADLHEYTYLVAGCVGEFWTHLCFRYVADFAEHLEKEMLELGKQYGTALQLVNILRDAHVDLRNGRCYFPEEELKAIGLEPSQILGEAERFQIVYRKWLEEAERGLKSGMEYVRAIRHRRVRAATALPALIGARTLALLRAAGAAALEQRIKVPRSEVRGMIGMVALTLAKRNQLDEMFERYRK